MTDPGGPSGPSEGRTDDLRRRLAERLAAVRERTLALVEPLTRDQLTAQPEPTMGVVGWDLGHIANFEELWLVRNLGGDVPADDPVGDLYDPVKHPRSERAELDLPARDELLDYLARTRKTTLAVLDEADLAGGERLVRDGFVHDMIVRHEQQHQENMLITLQMMDDGGVGAYQPPLREAPPSPGERPTGMVEVPAGTYPIGAPLGPGAYDCEAPAHEVTLDAFEIDRAPVTHGDYRAFIEDGGYDDERHWSEDGWMIAQALGLRHPKYWRKVDGTWRTRLFDRLVELPLDAPVVHVSYYEAEAYAAWAGKRLPSEDEWEVAATWDPESGTKRRFPWGDETWTPEHANLGQSLFAPAPVGAYPKGVSAVGCHQLCGDVWEWTSSVLTGYPGFEAFPYPEYSSTFFDAGYQVLRGGSWATWSDCAHGTFRNWHQPDHQQLFAGLRCARDAGGS